MLKAGIVLEGKYEIVELLGVGGFGSVFRARHQQLDRDVALKTINSSVLAEADGLARFEREARCITALRHKNIVSCYGYGALDGAPYMVMEFLSGRTLDKVIGEEGKLEPARALRLMRQVLEALAAAHAGGVVHRDLKPSNIMVMVDGDGKELIKIIDFGLAKLMPGYGVPGQKLTETGYALGSCTYMAPEQALGQPVDQRSDIYSAGCIFFEMLRGHAPFEAEENVAIMFRHLNEEPPEMGIRGAFGEAVDHFYRNCLIKEAARRYQNCAEAIADLDSIIDGRFDAVTPRVVRARKSKVRVNSKLMVAVSLVLMVVFAGALFASKQTADRNALAEKIGLWRQEIAEIDHAPVADQFQLSPAMLHDFMLAKAADDSSHFLNPGERAVLLTAVATHLRYAKGDPEVGNKAAVEALSLFNDTNSNSQWVGRLGAFFNTAGYFDPAERAYELAALHCPDKNNRAGCYFAWASVLQRRGEVQKSLDMCNDMTKRFSTDSRTYGMIGDDLVLLGRLKEAKAVYTGMITPELVSDEVRWKGCTGLARLALLDGDGKAAEKWMKDAMTLPDMDRLMRKFPTFAAGNCMLFAAVAAANGRRSEADKLYAGADPGLDRYDRMAFFDKELADQYMQGRAVDFAAAQRSGLRKLVPAGMSAS